MTDCSGKIASPENHRNCSEKWFSQDCGGIQSNDSLQDSLLAQLSNIVFACQFEAGFAAICLHRPLTGWRRGIGCNNPLNLWHEVACAQFLPQSLSRVRVQRFEIRKGQQLASFVVENCNRFFRIGQREAANWFYANMRRLN